MTCCRFSQPSFALRKSKQARHDVSSRRSIFRTLATELAESFAPSVEDDKRTLLWSIEPSVMLEGDRELLAQAFVNMLENAQRHTPEGTVIRLTLVSAGNVRLL